MADEDVISDIPQAEEGGEAATAIAPVKEPTPTKREPKQLPPYRVLLHNDDVNTFEHVILSIVKLTSLSAEEAVVRTLEAHETGVALLLVTHRERAELYQEQFASVSLIVTIEPD
jgi:ATP-dependent Clp protease adaptor protein ClpS